MEEQYKLPAQIRDALLKYLYTRPYGEVAPGVQMLSQLEKIEAHEPPAVVEE